MDDNNSTTSTPLSTGGVKFDTGKLPVELFSFIALLGTVRVLGFGVKKYAAHNWRKGIVWTRILGAILRHTIAIMLGEDVDPESGELHVDHLACEVMFLQEFYRTRLDLDDRYKYDRNIIQVVQELFRPILNPKTPEITKE